MPDHVGAASPICSERCDSANFQNSTALRTHYPSSHQASVAARPRTYLLQNGSYDISIHPRHLFVLQTVVFHPCFRHDFQTMAAVFYLTSSGRSARSSVYSRQASVSGFWCHRLERPATPRRICAVTRVFADNDSTPFCFPVSHDSCVTIPFITTIWTPVVLAIINIIYAMLKLKMFMMMTMMMKAYNINQFIIRNHFSISFTN